VTLPIHPEALRDAIRMPVPGWSEQPLTEGMRLWRDASGGALALVIATEDDVPRLADVTNLRHAARALAEENGGGLIEAEPVVTAAFGTGGRLIYKRLRGRCYSFTGMLWFAVDGHWPLWTSVYGEGGLSGIREAVVTAQLMSSGRLTAGTYESGWAADPYDASYCGVDRSCLRFLSDAPEYDAQFPAHPLTRVRAVLDALSRELTIDAPGAGTG
jgi:hypothetical protein